MLRSVALILVGLCSFNAIAAQRTIVNGSFETPVISGSWTHEDQVNVPGWSTTDTNGKIEIWKGLGGTVAADGSQVIEVNATSESTVYQEICLVNGESIEWSFWHKGRNPSETDTIILEFGAQSVFTATTSGAGTTLTQYTGTTVYTGANGIQQVKFAPGPTSGGASYGNLLDHVQMTFNPLVQFASATNGSVEEDGNDIPRLLIDGVVTAAATIDVVVVGGSATLGTDFNLVQTVNIPAGTYDGTLATSVPINLTILNTFDLEGDETIIFELSNGDGVSAQPSACGGAISQNTYTILDNDAEVDIAITKDDSLMNYSPGGAGSYSITITNNGPGDVMNALVVDDLPNGLSINGSSTCTATAPSSCTVTSGAADPVTANVTLENGASAILTIPVIFSIVPSDYLP